MLNRLSYILLLAVLALAAFIYLYFTSSSNAQPSRFTGVDRCRVCHEATSSGSQYKVWLGGSHAQAYNALLSDSSRSFLMRSHLTIDSCLQCHVTDRVQANNSLGKSLLSEGVGCERCHGAGSNYAYYNIMKSRVDFKSHGGVVGSLKDCYGCHAASIASTAKHCPFQVRDFNADSSWALIKHPRASTEKQTDTVKELR